MVYNPVRASLRTINPREVKALHQPDKLQSKVLLSNVRRVANLVRYVLTVLQFLNSVFSWENKVLSTVSLLVSVCVFYLQVYGVRMFSVFEPVWVNVFVDCMRVVCMYVFTFNVHAVCGSQFVNVCSSTVCSVLIIG